MKVEPSKPVTGAMPSVAAMSAVPSTTPSGITAAPERDRPRVDAAAALDSFLAMAVAARATDLHLVGGRPVLLRVASELVARTQSISVEHVDRIVKEVLPPRLREALDGEGSCDFAIDHAQLGRFRVNLSRHRGGTTIAIRVLGREFPSIRALGLPDAISAAAAHTQGLVLVTGPAGHGKTTTLAALVDAINANSDAPRHVCTIEDPIEHVHPKRRGMVTQREIGTHVKSWPQAIADALCSDVDVVVIGDLRGEGAVRAALTACDAGRLVLATMSCTSAARAVDRIMDRFPAAEQPRTRSTLASAIRLVIGQRLVPSADRERFHVALEALPGTSALYTLVRDGRTNQIPALQQRARSLGFMRLDDSLSELVRAQKVTLEVARQFAESPADLAAKKG
jgi:twitching motility protein PilT